MSDQPAPPRLVGMEEKVLMIYDATTFEPLRLATRAENFKPMIFRSRGRLVRPLMGYASELQGGTDATK